MASIQIQNEIYMSCPIIRSAQSNGVAPSSSPAHQEENKRSCVPSQGRIWMCCTGTLTLPAAAGAVYGFMSSHTFFAYLLSGASAAGALAGAVGFVASWCLAPQKNLENQIKDLEKQKKSLKTELGELKSLKERIGKTTSDIISNVTLSKEELARTSALLIESNNELEDRLAKAEKRASDLTELLADYRKHVGTMSEHVSAFRATGKELSSTIASAESVAAGVGIQAQRMQDAAKIIDQQEDEIRAERDSLQTLVNGYSEQITLIREFIHNLTLSNKALAEEVSELEVVKAQCEASDAKVEELNRRLEVITKLMEQTLITHEQEAAV